MEFEWNPYKADSNLDKHAVPFDDPPIGQRAVVGNRWPSMNVA